MTLLELLLLLLVAGILGSLGQAVAGYSHGGCLVSIVIGFVGALLGRWLSIQLRLPDLLTFSVGGQPFPVIWSIVGAALFVSVLSLFTRRRVI
ncbi:MAG: Transglycosylase associated protein [Acidobacteria bacterium]|jgi:uncharacterized membrane protein YeaQ/YmgE (transglycosylase-associated protein family)|nr:Transglycosylase associated protein [Acidobacteriota bacterium]